jgi:chorismate mutase
MASDSVPAAIPEELLMARDNIDRIDRELISLLGERFALTHEVGLLKADKNLNALDSSRESEKLAELRALSERHGLDPELISELFGRIMEEVVKNHKLLRE